ncbi:MAG: hypothetical protein ACHQSE_10870 [Gemmatimonadales bacterium]
MTLRPALRLTALAVAVFAQCVAAAAFLPRAVEAQTIDTVVVAAHNIFDRAQNAPHFLAKLGDAFHITTRPWVIRRALLISQGDRYDSARVVESERTLRRLGIFRQVRVDTSHVDGRLATVVTTDDGWTTVPQANYGTANGSVVWEAGLIESNFLGTATTLGADYRVTPDRHETELLFAHPSLFVRHDIANAEYLDRSDGTQADWIYGVPFFESAAKRALTTDGEEANQHVLVFRDGVEVGRPQRQALRFTVTSGIASTASSTGYTRLLLAATWRREGYSPDSLTAPPQPVFGTIGLGLDMGRPHLRVVENLNSIGRREDADITDRFNVGVWAAPRAFGYRQDHAGVGLATAIQKGTSWSGGFGIARVTADGVYGGAGLDSGRVTGEATAVQFASKSQSLLVHAEAGAMRNENPGGEFDLWTFDNGPRLYSAHTFTGNRMVWASMEDRFVVKEDFLGLVDVGLAPFVDYGGAWYSDESARLAVNVGMSLRLGLSRGTSGDVVEYAVGYRYGDKSIGRGWALTIRRAIIYFRPGTRRTGGAPNTYGPPLSPR